jgi:hypothetical protein
MVWVTLPKMPDTSGEGKYEVLDPDSLFRGKSYSDWTCDWLNWFLSKDADLRTSGPVVFLRSKGLPNSKTGANISDIPGSISELSDSNNSPYPESVDISGLLTNTKAYMNDPNVKVGGDRLRIFSDQVVFVPIILAYWLKTTPYADWGSMQDYTGLTIDYGDNPPERKQLTINGEAVVLPPSQGNKTNLQAFLDKKKEAQIKIGKIMKNEEGLVNDLEEKNERVKIAEIFGTNEKLQVMKDMNSINDKLKGIKTTIKNEEDQIKLIEIEIEKLQKPALMQQFRISTPIFTAIVPEAQYGRSAKDYLEETPVAPNNYPAMVDGYFIMLRFDVGTYWIHSWASAPRETRGPYFSELLYQIEVNERKDPRGKVTVVRPARNERILSQVLEQKTKEKDLTKRELERFKKYCSIIESEPDRRSVI